jgi:Spy/CpxP family protein refolding chaperone
MRRWALGLTAAMGSAIALTVWAAPMPPAAAASGAPAPHWHHPCSDGWHGPMAGGPGTPMGHHLGRMLQEVHASDAQRAQITSIEEATAKDLKPQFDHERELHEKLAQALSQPTIDAAGIETLREEMQAQHDEISKRTTQSMIDIAKVLTPEQRKLLADHASERRAHMREPMRGHHGPWHAHGMAPAAASAPASAPVKP